jgi:hypothetical protein
VRTAAERSWHVWVATTRRRASTRSVTTPAKRPNTMKGKNCANAITPTANGECVSW